MNERAERLLEIVRKVNSWDGSLENLDFNYNDEDNLELFFSGRIGEFARSVTYGHYHFRDDYFRFDGNGNIQTFTENEVEKMILDWEEDILNQAIHVANNNIDMLMLLDIVKDYKEIYEE